jgi:hypothetical protein
MSKSHGGVSSLGGWLYADLMLILFIGILSQVALPPKKIVDIEPTVTPTPTSTPTPTVTPTIRPTVLARVGRESENVSMRTTPSMDGVIQGQLDPDSLVYIIDQDGEWASVVITTYIDAAALRDPSDPMFETPLLSTETPIPTRPAEPTPTPTALPSIDREPIEIVVSVPPGLSANASVAVREAFRDSVVEALERALADRGLPPQSEIGMILAFGGAPKDQPEIGNGTSRRANDVLDDVLYDAAGDRFSRAGFESFHSFSVGTGQVNLWIYVFVN